MNEENIPNIWDVVVVGTGVGGGTIGRRLSEAGLSVLFVEKGRLEVTGTGDRYDPLTGEAAVSLAKGYWPKPLNAMIDGKKKAIPEAIGCGVGGSSAFYAATLERPEPHDLDHSKDQPHPSGGWPVNYLDFLPYFEQVERLFYVCGSQDPLSSQDCALLAPPPLEQADVKMMTGFVDLGLHPYLAHQGVRYVPECSRCFGSKCPKRCKMDSRVAGVDPAIVTGNAVLLDGCEVMKICGDGDVVSHLSAVRDGSRFELHARRYVLSAGALGTPRLLLKSASPGWPEGCANSSGLVGRNLMFHLSELVAIWPKQRQMASAPSRSITMRDFYASKGDRFGSFQAMGVDVSFGEVYHYFANVFDRSTHRSISFLRPLLRIPAYIMSRVFGRAQIYVGILEDFPGYDNCVLIDQEDQECIRFQYRVTQELKQRRLRFRRLIKKKLKGLRFLFLSHSPDLNIAHCCGTARFGRDPALSVLDPNCRSHDIANLYVADASFMPSSMGINPSLMIAANALRVADKILEEISASEERLCAPNSARPDRCSTKADLGTD